MTTPHRVTIDSIEPRAWRVRLRDHATGQSNEVELRGNGPWQLSINGKPEVAAAPPPDAAITLRLDNQGGRKTVRVAAAGRGAIAWSQGQGSLMGASWQTDDKGAPVLELPDSPTLVLDLQKALPEVALDLSRYEGPSKSAAVKTGARVKAEEPASTDAITLRLESTAEGVRVFASGRGAIAWTEREGSLLGAKWFRDAKGRPLVLLDDRPSLVGELEKLHPTVTLDLAKYTPAASAAPSTSAAEKPAAEKPARPRKAAAEPEPAAEPARKPPARASDKTAKPGRSDMGKAESAPTKPEAKPEPAPETTPARARKKASPAPGPGPGGLEWTALEDGGLAARWKNGAFKLLHAGGDRYALFYEHDGGGYETLSCGLLGDLKQIASERVAGTRGAVSLDAQLAQVACATPPARGPVTNEAITLHLRRSETTRAVVLIRATGDRAHEWAFRHKKALGSEWSPGEDGQPEVHKHDSPTLVADLRKEFPGVTIDTSAYKKLGKEGGDRPRKAEPAPPEPPPSTPPAPEPAPTPAPAPAAEPPAEDAQAAGDRELMADFRKELATLFDEEDD